MCLPGWRDAPRPRRIPPSKDIQISKVCLAGSFQGLLRRINPLDRGGFQTVQGNTGQTPCTAIVEKKPWMHKLNPDAALHPPRRWPGFGRPLPGGVKSVHNQHNSTYSGFRKPQSIEFIGNTVTVHCDGVSMIRAGSAAPALPSGGDSPRDYSAFRRRPTGAACPLGGRAWGKPLPFFPRLPIISSGNPSLGT